MTPGIDSPWGVVLVRICAVYPLRNSCGGDYSGEEHWESVVCPVCCYCGWSLTTDYVSVCYEIYMERGLVIVSCWERGIEKASHENENV